MNICRSDMLQDAFDAGTGEVVTRPTADGGANHISPPRAIAPPVETEDGDGASLWQLELPGTLLAIISTPRQHSTSARAGPFRSQVIGVPSDRPPQVRRLQSSLVARPRCTQSLPSAPFSCAL